MKNSVEIIEDISDFERVTWRFRFISSLSNNRFCLERWAHESRETKRHKWRCSQHGSTLWLRCVGERRYNRINMPEIPNHVAKQTAKEFADSIVISKDEM